MRLAFASKWHEQARERVNMKVTKYKVCIDGRVTTLELSREFVGKPSMDTLRAWMRSCVANINAPVEAVRIEDESGAIVYSFTLDQLGQWQQRTWLQKHNERVSRERKAHAAQMFTSNKKR